MFRPKWGFYAKPLCTVYTFPKQWQEIDIQVTFPWDTLKISDTYLGKNGKIKGPTYAQYVCGM